MSFNEKEMHIRYVLEGKNGRIDLPVYDAPITVRENLCQAIFEKKALFMPDYRHFLNFTPRVIPDNEARCAVYDGGEPCRHPEGFPDMFGIKWHYIEVAGGSMVDPGDILIEDMNDWEEKVTWPDIDSWDWEAQRKLSEKYVTNSELPLVSTILNGYFERLISMMGFEGAAMALIDDDQKEVIHSFFDKLADLYIRLIDKMIAYFPETVGITIHDDWGSQRAPFFSLNTVMEMLVPPMKRVADHIHSTGRFYDMHCCGQVESLIPGMVAIGVDCWCGQPMNDQAMLFHKYGKDIMIGINTEPIPADMPEEVLKQRAKMFAEEFMEPGAIGMFGFNTDVQNPAFYEYLYRYSRARADELGF